jgi:hypothetical protein
MILFIQASKLHADARLTLKEAGLISIDAGII